MLRYKDLSVREKELLTNGCGAKGGFFNPPEFIFHASCNKHDFYYWRGGSKKDRKIADVSYYKYMKLDIKRYSGFQAIKFKIIAYVYYKAVRIFGKKHFHHSSSYRTYEDVLKFINKV